MKVKKGNSKERPSPSMLGFGLEEDVSRVREEGATKEGLKKGEKGVESGERSGAEVG